MSASALGTSAAQLRIRSAASDPLLGTARKPVVELEGPAPGGASVHWAWQEPHGPKNSLISGP